MKSRGFTLIEVLIAVGVIGILSAIALPIYRGYVAKAEAASLTVAGLSSNFQSQLDAAESNTGSSNSGTAPTTAVSSGQTDSTTMSNGDTTAPSNNAVSSTSSTNSGSTEPSATASTDSTDTDTNTSSAPPPNVSASGSGGGSNASPSTPTIGVPEAFKDCDPCGIGKKKTVQIAFDLSSFGTLDSDSIASGKTGSAITGNPSGQYNAENGQYVVTISTHKDKDKTGTLSVSIDGQSTTINLKTI